MQRLTSWSLMGLMICLWMLPAPHALASWDDLTAHELYERSLETPSLAERAMMRRYLADHHGGTPEGYFGQAWIDSREQRESEAIRGYQKAFDQDPTLGAAAVNLGYKLVAEGRVEEGVTKFREAYEAVPDDLSMVRVIYFHLLEDLDAAEDARQFLQQQERLLGQDAWVIQLISGLYAQFHDNDLQTAADAYLGSARAGGPTESMRRYINVSLDRLNTDANEVLRHAITYAKKNSDAKVLQFVGDRMASLSARTQALAAYRASMQIYPTAETLENAVDKLARHLPSQTFDLVDEWAPRMANNWLAQATLAETYDRYRFDVPRADQLRQKSIELAPSGPDRTKAVQSAAGALRDRFALDQASSLLERHAGTLPSASNRNLMQALITENRFWAGDYQGALEASARLPDSQVAGVNEDWLRDLRENVSRAAGLAETRQAFYREHPFLQRWQERFGDSLTLSVEFDVNSARIQPGSHGRLAEAAQALRLQGGDEYTFLVEGHTDSSGTDAINQPLSERRARAVADFLSTEHDLPRARLQSIGHGAKHPVATNETNPGRQSNRRVEIRPYGNIEQPEVAVSGQLNTDRLAVSPDGRLLATGSGPIQIWDTRRNVKIRELFRGGSIRAFSPDSRYLAAASSYQEVSGSTSYMLYVYDTKTGHAVAQIPDGARITGLAWSPFGDELVYSTMQGYLRVLDVKEARVRSVSRAGPIHGVTLVEWLADGKRIVSDQVRSPGPMVWDAGSLAVEQRLDGQQTGRRWPHAIRGSRDGRWLVTADNSRQITIHDTRDWTSRTLRSPNVPKQMEPHPARPWMVLNDFTKGKEGIVLLDVENGRILATTGTDSQRAAVGFTPDGSQVVAGYGDRIRWLDTESLVEVDQLEGLASRSEALRVDRVNDYVITTDKDGTYVFDLSSGRRVHRMVTDTDFTWTPLNKDGTRLATVDVDGHLVVFDSETFSERRMHRFDIDVTRYLSVDGDYIVAVGVPEGQGENAESVGKAVILDRQGFGEVARIEFPLVTAPVLYGRVIEPKINWVAMDAEKDLVALNSVWQDGVGRPTQSSESVRLFRLSDGQKLGDIRTNYQVNGVRFDEDGYLAIDRYGAGEVVYDAEAREKVNTRPVRTRMKIALDDGRTLYWSRDYLTLGDRRVRFPDSLRRLVTHEARNMLIAQTEANELLFFDINTLEQHLTIVVKRNDQWIAYTPAGHYASSQHGTDGVFWSLGDYFLPFDALSEEKREGRLVRERLRALMSGTPAPEVVDNDEADIDPALFDTPYQVRMLSETGVETDQATFRVQVEVTKTSTDLPDPDFRYTLNGRPVPSSRGFDEEAVWDGEEVLTVERELSLQEGYNRIEVALSFRDASVERRVVEVHRRAAPAPSGISSQTQLWFFGVGVSDYQINTQNLEFAHRDAQELAKVFEAQEGVLYNKVNTRVLVNEEATERNVRVELNDFLRQASAEDLIVIFLAGHGVQDNEQNLFLITHDGDIQRPYTGMSVERFRDFLRSRPMNQKALLMMDICHAGSTGPRRRGRVTAEDAVQQLSEGTGTVVFASSTGSQSSLEDASYGGGHGAFTAALLEGFRGEADQQAGDSDGYNSIHEVISYTSRRVPQITQGAQHPTVPMLENVRDFPMSTSN